MELPLYQLDSEEAMRKPQPDMQLNKEKMFAKQLSSRGGQLLCEIKGERVLINGEVPPYLQGVITL